MDSPRRSVLMLAFQFPPYEESTGSQRTLAFIRHLPAFGWSPIVVTAQTSAYPRINPGTVESIPPGTTVFRAFAFDIKRTLSFRGIYPRALSTPDRWNSWIVGSIVTGLKAIREHKPSVLWATFPLPSALAAGIALSRLTGLPLIGDLRDPMLYETWPEGAWERKVYGVIERALVRNSTAVVLTTPGARRLYQERYLEHTEKFYTIANGMDAIDDSARAIDRDASASDRPITLVHSGLMEMPDRDPAAFFAALRELARRGDLANRRIRVVLRASGRESLYTDMLRANGISELVEIAPRISRAEAMEEMHSASALLLFQGRHCNRQIPAKAYEYLFMSKPIICLANHAGDTHALVGDEWGVPYCADMEDPEDIARTLRVFLDYHRRGNVYVPPVALRERHTRRAQAGALTELLDNVTRRASNRTPR
jgi:glycosyltransferase involved in cell wall biosynthesis